MSDSYWIQFLMEELPTVGDVVRQCHDVGLGTTADGDVEACQTYSVDGTRTKHDAGGDDIETVIEQLSQARMGRLSFWDDSGMEIVLAFSNIDEQNWNTPRVIIEFDTLAIDPDVVSDDVVRDRIDTIVATTVSIAEVVEPVYAWGSLRVAQDPDKGLKPTAKPVSEHISSLSWITVISSETAEAFGGREYVLSGPAWRYEELSTGHIVIVDRDHPARGSASSSPSVTEQLLGVGEGD